MAVSNSPVDLENLRGAIGLGQQTLKSLELANGGAVVAILTFYGNVVKDSGGKIPIDRHWISTALVMFAAGLFAALVAAVLGYMGQVTVATAEPPVSTSAAEDAAYRAPRLAASDRLLRGAVLVGFISLIFFAGGIGCSIKAFAL